MKKAICVLIILALAGPAWTQEPSISRDKADDPFLHYVSKIWNTTSLSYDAMYRQKSLFDKDTITSFATVSLVKHHDVIRFLQIVSTGRENELVFANDTAWAVSHLDSSASFLGAGIGEIEGNPLAVFFPHSLFTLDSSAYLIEPFWETISETAVTRTVSIGIRNKPEEITEIRYEVTIGRGDSLISRVVESVTFAGYEDGQYQEKRFYDYRIAAKDHGLPAYFDAYRTILPDPASAEKEKPTGGYVDGEEILLSGLSLLDMSEQPFALPDDGLIFIDLWYVGCYPCMKAAPVMEKLYREYRDKIHFYSVNEVDKNLEKIRDFKSKLDITFPVLLNRQESLAVKVNGSKAYPAYFIMEGETGKVVWRGSGYSEDLEMKLRNVFDAN